MSNCKSSAVSTYEKYSGVAQFIASSIGKSKVCRPESQTSANSLIYLFFIVLQKIHIYF